MDIRPAKKTKSLVEEKCEQIQELVDELKACHQYQLWAEAIDVNHHNSMVVPPTGSREEAVQEAGYFYTVRP